MARTYNSRVVDTMKLYIGTAVLLLMASVNGQAIYTETWDVGFQLITIPCRLLGKELRY